MEEIAVIENKTDKNMFQKIVDKFSTKDEPFTAEKAWIETTYGIGSYKSIDKRIEDKQIRIRSSIKSKFCDFNGGTTKNTICYSSYYCVVDIEEDLVNSVDEIFKPFVDNGFVIVNLSDVIEEVKGENVYLISWKNVFNKK